MVNQSGPPGGRTHTARVAVIPLKLNCSPAGDWVVPRRRHVIGHGSAAWALPAASGEIWEQARVLSAPGGCSGTRNEVPGGRHRLVHVYRGYQNAVAGDYVT